MNKLTAHYEIALKNDIIHFIFHNYVILRYNDVKEMHDYVNKVFSKKRYLRLIDMRAPVIFEDKARFFIQGTKIKYRIKAQAVLIGSETNQEGLDVFMEMNSRKTPVKVFVDYDASISWLNSGTFD